MTHIEIETENEGILLFKLMAKFFAEIVQVGFMLIPFLHRYSLWISEYRLWAALPFITEIIDVPGQAGHCSFLSSDKRRSQT